MCLSRIADVARLLFSPSVFIRRAVDQDCTNADQRQAYEAECQGRVAKKRKGVLISLAITLGVCITAVLTAKFLNLFIQFGEQWITSLRILSGVIIAWSVLSRLGYDVDTWKGETVLEQTSQFMFKFFYLIALYLVVVSFFLADSP